MSKKLCLLTCTNWQKLICQSADVERSTTLICCMPGNICVNVLLPMSAGGSCFSVLHIQWQLLYCATSLMTVALLLYKSDDSCFNVLQIWWLLLLIITNLMTVALLCCKSDNMIIALITTSLMTVALCYKHKSDRSCFNVLQKWPGIGGVPTSYGEVKPGRGWRDTPSTLLPDTSGCWRYCEWYWSRTRGVVYTCVCVCVHMGAHMSVCLHSSMCICVYECVCVHASVCMCVHAWLCVCPFIIERVHFKQNANSDQVCAFLPVIEWEWNNGYPSYFVHFFLQCV